MKIKIDISPRAYREMLARRNVAKDWPSMPRVHAITFW